MQGAVSVQRKAFLITGLLDLCHSQMPTWTMWKARLRDVLTQRSVWGYLPSLTRNAAPPDETYDV